MKKTILFLLLIALFEFQSNAHYDNSIPISTQPGPIEDAVNQIESALSALEIQSENWQQILEELITTIESGLKADIQNILDRAVSSTTEQANCLMDIRTRAIESELQNIISRLTGAALTPIGPAICQASPSSIQMALLTENSSYSRTIHISGYNLDKGKYSIKLLTRKWNFKKHRIENEFKTISRGHLTIQTPYHAVFNYSDVNLTTQSKKFIIYHDGVRLIEIGIEQKTCELKFEESAEQTATVSDFRRNAGDIDFGWNNARFRVDVDLYITDDQQQVKAKIMVSVRETNGGDTRGSASETVTLFTNTQSDYRIDAITSGTGFPPDSFTNTSESGDSKNYGDGGPVKRINFYGRSFGFDDLNKAKINVQFNEITVRLVETTLCIEAQ